jgi:hypothetical protein
MSHPGLSRGERLAVGEITDSLSRIETLLIGILHALTDGDVPPGVHALTREELSE